MNELINGKNIAISYDGKKILSGVNFTLNKGEVLCIIGENGSGKTSLVKSILGMKKLSEGAFTGISDISRIGYLAQKDEIQKDFPAKVKEVVLSGRLNDLGYRPFYRKKDKEIALENIKKLGIEAIMNKSFNEISGGQRQRVLIARALCATGEILILDEPEASLDPVVTKSLFSLIKEIKNDNNIGIVIVSHNLNTSLDIADKVLHLKAFGEDEHFFGNLIDYKDSPLAKGFMGGEI